MNHGKMNGDIGELYPDGNDAASRRSLEELAHAIDRFRFAVHQLADRHAGARWTAPQLEEASRTKRSAQRRVMLEWAVAAMLCVTMLIPALGYMRSRDLRLEAQRQQQMLRQRQADEALLEQVSSEISETLPDSMQPLALSAMEKPEIGKGEKR